MTDSTAITKRELPSPIATVLREITLSEEIVRAALNSTYRGCPPEEVARALVKCARYSLDPCGDHVAVFRPKGSDRYVIFVTLKGYEECAARHPDFGALTFGEFEERGNEIWVAAYVHRKSFAIPSGPFWGRAEKLGKRSEAKGGGSYDVPWPHELAQARAARTALRRVIGLTLPEDDFTDHPRPWREEQRKRLWFLANALGWDDARRHAEASVVLGREVTSWQSLTEEEATRLDIAWAPMLENVVKIEVNQLEKPPPPPALAPAPPPSPTPTATPIGGEGAPASTEQMASIAAIARAYRWGAEEIREALGDIAAITAEAATEFLEQMVPRAEVWRLNRIKRLQLCVANRDCDVEALMAERVGHSDITALQAHEAWDLIDELEATPPSAPTPTPPPAPTPEERPPEESSPSRAKAGRRPTVADRKAPAAASSSPTDAWYQAKACFDEALVAALPGAISRTRFVETALRELGKSWIEDCDIDELAQIVAKLTKRQA